jgi:mono/diheme cytochrome c family protein
MSHNDAKYCVWVWAVVFGAALGIVTTSCSTTDRSSRMRAHDPSPRGPAAPPGVQGDPPSSPASVQKGKDLFDTLGCMGCHTVNGQGGTVGPNLSHEGDQGRSRQWLETQIRHPRTYDPQTLMPSYDNLSDEQVSSLVDYLLSLRTHGGSADTAPAAAPPAAPSTRTISVAAPSSRTAGAMLWSETCGQCHNLRPPSEYSDAQWSVAVQHMRVRVPLTGEQQRKILEFLQASN